MVVQSYLLFINETKLSPKISEVPVFTLAIVSET